MLRPSNETVTLQAIPEGSVDRNEIRVTTRLHVDGRVAVEIRDSGTGIPPALLKRIFDPFFTTKPVGTGTGLGLSICHGIVVGLGGAIEVESVVGKGTMFRVLLPVASSEAVSPGTATGLMPGKAGRVLVIDDEPLLVAAFRRCLESEHTLTTVLSGKAALELFRTQPSFDVILCGLMMPEMTGMDVFAEGSRAYPSQAQRMVFITGGAFTPKAREFLEKVPNPRRGTGTATGTVFFGQEKTPKSQ